MKVCDYCGNNIAEGRLKIFPNTNLCSAKCVNEIKDSYEEVQKSIALANNDLTEEFVGYIKSGSPDKNISSKFSNFKKFRESFPREYEPVLKELSYRKYTTIRAYNDYLSGEISENEYVVKFKRFTWWIKEKVESINGYLIDNPANYTHCKTCGNLSLVQWTPKYQKYFIGCSNFKNGCKWIKTIWIM